MERDKFLTEAMRECWHEYYRTTLNATWCGKCGKISPTPNRPFPNNDFSTWPGFGKLWEWAQGQEWWEEFLRVYWNASYWDSVASLIHPDRFSNAVYEFLKERA